MAQLPKPGYNLFLEQIQDKIPVLSNDKVYCRSMGEYVDYDDLSAEEARLMQLYNYLVYNAVYDVEDRSKLFKGIEEGE